MLKILVLIDGSECSSRAVKYVIELSAICKEAPDIHLLNVQMPITPGNIGRHVNRADLDDYYHDEGVAALTPARRLLNAAGVKHAFHIGVGDIAETVAKYVKELAAGQVAMGTRGLGPIAGMLLGSVAAEVVQLIEVPVLLVK
ncbi:MAG TPA: universal stress protein [Casimicrobiaceae bacterium]|jgi:nucleotide-binding universal stress UspA family protein